MTVTGWRCWDISSDGALWSPLNYGDDVTWQPGPMHATCSAPIARERHAIPDPSCSCGFRAVADLDAFLAAILETPHLFLPKVCGIVRLGGRICGADSYGDPDGAVRGEYAAITGPLFLGQPFTPAVAAVAASYGTDVIVGAMPQPEWVSGGLAADWKAYQDNPLSLGPRLYRPNRAARRRAAATMRKWPQ